MVEELHVFAVLVGPLAVVFRILLGIAARTEGLVADRGEDDGNDAPIERRIVEPGDHAFYHVGRV